MLITIEQLANIALLTKSWKAVRHKKSKEVAKFSRGIDKITLEDFKKKEKENLDSLSKILNSKKYKPQAVKIHLEEKDKEKKKYRMIAIPIIADRIVQRAILNLFEPHIFPIINNGVSYCGVKNEEDEPVNTKNAIEKIISHIEQGYFWIFESDIVSFYDEITKTAMLDKLKDVTPMDETLSDLVKQYIYYEIGNPKIFDGKENVKIPNQIKGITQGSALSPIFANLYLSDFDRAMSHTFGDRFIRYVDDFIVMCKTEQEAQLAKQLAIQELDKLSLKLSPDHPDPKKTKTRIQNLQASEKVDFLGISISRRALTPKGGIKEAKKHMNNILSRKNKKGKKQYKRFVDRNGKILDISDQIEEKINSWGEHYRFYHVEELYTELDNYIEEKTKKMRDVRPIKPLNKIVLSPVKSHSAWKKLFEAK